MVRPCLLIPVYNHGSLIRATLARLESLALPCLIVDDGSDEATANILRALEQEKPWLTLLRQPLNQGKGVAVLHGFAHAKQLGYTHAIQLDADGQHTLEDIPQMLAMAEETPEALISGAPIFDETVPKARYYGRYVTHFWVWIETLSFDIVDSMCGFRVYPLNASVELAAAERIGRRMDFDTDILVRLYWRGIPVRFLPSRVSYPADGISHFAPWADNVRITLMHTRLVFGMLRRLPVLLRRKLAASRQNSETTHWSTRAESGAFLAMSAGAMCYRVLGRRGMRFLLYPIIAYFFLSNAAARRASREFLQRVYHSGGGETPFFNRAPTWWDSFKHFLTFGQAIIDRIGSWLADVRREDVVFKERQRLLDCVASGRGAFIFSSHLGNAEMCRALVDGVPGLKMNVLVFNDNAQKINRMMKRLNPRADLELIQISTVDPGTAMLLNEKINRGEFVIIAADRTSPTSPEKSTRVPFMGGMASFPQGAFVLASLFSCPVFVMFCIDQGGYHIYLEHFADNMSMPRRQRAQLLQQYTRRYAQRLEHYALMAPLQWFNFFDFWAQHDHVPGPLGQLGSGLSDSKESEGELRASPHEKPRGGGVE